MTPQQAYREDSTPISAEESARIRERLHKLEQYPNLVEANHRMLTELDDKLHKDKSGQPSWQTRLDRIERVVQVVAWISGTAATASIGQIVVKIMDAVAN